MSLNFRLSLEGRHEVSVHTVTLGFCYGLGTLTFPRKGHQTGGVGLPAALAFWSLTSLSSLVLCREGKKSVRSVGSELAKPGVLRLHTAMKTSPPHTRKPFQVTPSVDFEAPLAPQPRLWW